MILGCDVKEAEETLSSMPVALLGGKYRPESSQPNLTSDYRLWHQTSFGLMLMW